jgi:hypothetical protein
MKTQIRVVLCSVGWTLVTGLLMSPQAGLSLRPVYAGQLPMEKCPHGWHVNEICVARRTHGAPWADQVRAFIAGESVPEPTTILRQCSGHGHDCRLTAAHQGPTTSWQEVAPGHTYRGCAAFTDAMGRRHYSCSPLLAVSISGPAGERPEEEVHEPPALEEEFPEEVHEPPALEAELQCPPLLAVSISELAGERQEEEWSEPPALEEEFPEEVQEHSTLEEEIQCSPLLTVSVSGPEGEVQE